MDRHLHGIQVPAVKAHLCLVHMPGGKKMRELQLLQHLSLECLESACHILQPRSKYQIGKKGPAKA